MPVQYRDLAALLGVYPVWTGFDDCGFSLQIMPLAAAITDLKVCMDSGASTLEQYAVTAADDYLRYVDNYDPSHPLFVVAFSRAVLHGRWATSYPDAEPTEDLIVTDGNHRLVSLARRRSNGVADRFPVGVFVCR